MPGDIDWLPVIPVACYLLLMMFAECLLSGGRGGGVAEADSP